MEFNDYQEKASTTAVYPGAQEKLSELLAKEVVKRLENVTCEHFSNSVISEIADVIKIVDTIPLLYCAIGLADEAGEVAGKVKKLMRDGGGVITDEFKEAVGKEIGDTQWYQANLAKQLDLKLDDIAQGNLEKLFGRRERGTLHGSGDNR